jgi:glycosyltransferase involved in cell wall biosynthesis
MIPLAIIANAQTPYRLHLHQRLVDELPEIELWSLFTHEVSNAPWRYRDVERIRPVLFGRGEQSRDQDRLARQRHEWNKGGEIIDWLKQHGIRAIVLFGYNDLSRVRIIRWAHQQHIPCFLFGDSNILTDAITGTKAALKQSLLPVLLRQTTGAFCCGRLGREYFERYQAPRIYPFPYEPDYPALERISPTEMEEARRHFGLPRGRRFILFSGRLVAPKRVDLLLQAFAQIAADRPDWDLVLAGDGDLRHALAAQSSAVLRDRIYWTGFVDSPVLLGGLYHLSDVLVLPSDFEPWGVVVTEAAACGLALITSDRVGAGADLVQPGVNGQTFPAGDAARLTDALGEVTAPGNIDRYRAQSRPILKAWRATHDPVAGLRRALSDAGIELSEAVATH